MWSMKLGTDTLHGVASNGVQEGPGFTFTTDEVALSTDVTNTISANLAPMRIGSANGIQSNGDYAATWSDLVAFTGGQASASRYEWVHLVIETTSLNPPQALYDNVRSTLDIGTSDLKVFVKDTCLIMTLNSANSATFVNNSISYTNDAPLMVVQLGSGLVYKGVVTVTAGGTRENITVTELSGVRRYRAAGYFCSATPGGGLFTADREYKTSATQITPFDYFPSWEQETTPYGVDGWFVLVENKGLCCVIDSGNNYRVEITWGALKETNALVEIYDAVNPSKRWTSSWSNCVFQLSNTIGIELTSAVPAAVVSRDPNITFISATAVDTAMGGIYTLQTRTAYEQETWNNQVIAYGTANNSTGDIEVTVMEPSGTVGVAPALITSTYNPTTTPPYSTGSNGVLDLTPPPSSLSYPGRQLIPLPVYTTTEKKRSTVYLMFHKTGDDNVGVWVYSGDQPSRYMPPGMGQKSVQHNMCIGNGDASTSIHSGALVVNGGLGVTGEIHCHNIYSLSDSKLKTGIASLRQCLPSVRGLNPASWSWRANGGHDAGFIAQDVAAVLPESVRTDPLSGTMSVNYNSLLAHVAGAVKELAAELDDLKAKKQKVSHGKSS